MADWYAFEEIESALDRTKELLLPFDAGTWARLLILVIFTGAGFNMPAGDPGNIDSSPDDFSQTDNNINTELPSALSQPATGLSTGIGVTPLAVFAVLFIVGSALFLFYIQSVMSLIYYQSLLNDNVKIRKNFRKHARKGFSYFGFQLTVVLGLILILGIPIAVTIGLSTLGLLLFIPVIPIFLAILVFLSLTDNFVLPRMIEADETVVEAWRSIYSDLREEWKQIGVYLLVKIGLNIIAGMIGVFWLIATLLSAVIVFGIIALPLYLITPVLAVIPVVVGLIAWLLALILIQVPIQTYMRYYAILVYHDLTS